MENNFVTQLECEQRRANIAKEYDELAERVRIEEINATKFNERIKTLFNVLKFLSGIVAAVIGAEIINLIGRLV